MELDVISSKLDLMKETCSERMKHLETSLVLSIESRNNLLMNRVSTLENTLVEHGKTIDKLKEWRFLQIGALIIIAIILEQIAARIPWWS